MKVKGLLVLGEYDSDPSSPPNGSLWFNLTTEKFMKRVAGVTSEFGSGGGTSPQKLGKILALKNFNY